MVSTAMNRRSAILHALLENSGPVSGTEISRRLGISRNAVHKHIRTLIGDGYRISACPGVGYQLEQANERLDFPAMRPLLLTRVFGHAGWVYAERIDSTNQELQRRAAKGAPHGFVVTADAQSAGRGRKGRSWISPPGVGLYVSLLLRPNMALEHIPLIALLGAVAAAEAVREVTGCEALIKWPNDILVNGRKTAGLLLESASELDAIDFVIVGLGLNVNTTGGDLPERPLFPAGSLREATGKNWPRPALLAAWLKFMETGCEELDAGQPNRILRKARSWSALFGRRVRIESTHGATSGIVRGIDDSGALQLEDEHGAITGFLSGDLLLDRGGGNIRKPESGRHA